MIALKLLAKMTKMPKKVNMLGSKNIKGKKKSPFMIYTCFEIILVPEDNGKQNLDESLWTNIKSMLLAVMVIK